MTVSSKTSTPPRAADRTNDERPLLSDTGREFLDGRVDAEAYVDKARDITTERVKKELYKTIIEDQRGFRRRIALSGLIGATIAYALLGLGTLLARSNSTLVIAAFATSAVGVLVTIGYGRHDDGAPLDRGHGRGGALHHIIDRLIYRSMAYGFDHEITGRK